MIRTQSRPRVSDLDSTYMDDVERRANIFGQPNAITVTEGSTPSIVPWVSQSIEKLATRFDRKVGN